LGHCILFVGKERLDAARDTPGESVYLKAQNQAGRSAGAPIQGGSSPGRIRQKMGIFLRRTMRVSKTRCGAVSRNILP